ncbi:nuclear transport factor 2 family protein [Pseudomonas bohemica]|uniref:nuclear transport factor 2 family protein n=1 Tax=Pseudomonas bohemica TaxID=2044872 RepID=UPI000DA63627|nr:DUF4440 domain-containing protein [Pseudomonas bohemica]
MTLHTQILRLEERLLERATRLDDSILDELLAADFVEFGASGGVWNKTDVIAGLKTELYVARRITDFEIRELADNVVLATYQCHAESTEHKLASVTLRSSIWHKRLERWQLVFHQGTRVPG